MSDRSLHARRETAATAPSSAEPAAPPPDSGPRPLEPPPGARVRLQDDTVQLEATLRDPDVARALADVPAEARGELVVRALKVGLLALRDSQLVGRTDYVEKEFERMRAEFDRTMERMFGEHGQVTTRLHELFGDDGRLEQRLREFFGDQGRFHRLMNEFLGEDGKLARSVHSAVGEEGALQRTLEEFLGERGRLRQELDRQFGEDGGRLYRMLNPSDESTPLGKFRHTLEQRLDPDREGSMLWGLKDDVRTQFREIREGLGIREALADERERGTGKGTQLEQRVVGLVHGAAAPYGDRVEHVGREEGVSGDVGDLLCHLDPEQLGGLERRIVVEVKNRGVRLSGKDSIYRELDRAMDNRDAHFGIAVVREDHAQSFAPFRYTAPRHLLVAVSEDEEDPLALRVAYTLARTLVAVRAGRREPALDLERLEGHLRDIAGQLERVRAIKLGLTTATQKIEEARDAIDEMRSGIQQSTYALQEDIRTAAAEAKAGS